MSVKCGEIVEVSCKIPNDVCKIHMVLVVSTDELSEAESGMFYGIMITTKPYNEEYKIEITDDMLTTPLTKKSFFATHLLAFFEPDEITKHCKTALKEKYIDMVLNKVIDNIFGM